MFCMLLRKHLTGARIESVQQPEWERMVVLSLTGRDELGVECARTLVVELMGRASNVILCDEEMRIIDCLRRVDFGEEAYRRLLPGMLYKYPQRPDKPGNCWRRRRAARGHRPGCGTRSRPSRRSLPGKRPPAPGASSTWARPWMRSRRAWTPVNLRRRW